MAPFALTGAAVFDGETLQEDAAVVISAGLIEAVCPRGELADDMDRHRLGGGLLAPGFVDIQVNGGGGAASHTRSMAKRA